MNRAREDGGPRLEAASITVRRGGRALVDGVSLGLAPGRVTAIVGPNGAGKSTLLRVLAGELRPDAGAVSYGGRPLAEWGAAELARRRAVLPQESDLRFPFRVEEVVRLGRTPHPGAGETGFDRALAREALAKVDLVALAERHYPTLSGGERQRVHLARAWAQLQAAPGAGVPDGRVLLLDEPTSSLDLAHQHGVLTLVRNMAHGEGVAVLAVLHDLNLVLAYADDVVVLRGGRVAGVGEVVTTLTAGRVSEVFGVTARLVRMPGSGPGCFLFGRAG